MRIGRIGPFSRHAHFLSVCGARLIADAASLVGRTVGKPTSVRRLVSNVDIFRVHDCRYAMKFRETNSCRYSYQFPVASLRCSLLLRPLYGLGLKWIVLVQETKTALAQSRAVTGFPAYLVGFMKNTSLQSRTIQLIH